MALTVCVITRDHCQCYVIYFYCCGDLNACSMRMMIIHISTRMSRITLVLFATLLVAAMSVKTFDKVKDLLKEDTCAVDAMALIQPEIETVVAQLKAVRLVLSQNPQDLKAKTELLALVEKVRAVYEACELNKKVDPVLGDIVEAGGVGFLLASNCFKDVGIVLLLADTVVQDPTDYTNDTIVLIFLYILGRQGYGDCQQFVNFIV